VGKKKNRANFPKKCTSEPVETRPERGGTITKGYTTNMNSKIERKEWDTNHMLLERRMEKEPAEIRGRSDDTRRARRALCKKKKSKRVFSINAVSQTAHVPLKQAECEKKGKKGKQTGK